MVNIRNNVVKERGAESILLDASLIVSDKDFEIILAFEPFEYT
jgi:hypothetical protein